MSLTFAQLRKKETPFSVNLGTDEAPEILEGAFNPRIYTPAYIIDQENADLKDPKVWARTLCPLLTKLDVTYSEEDAADGVCTAEQVGKPYELTEDNLARIPIEILLKIAVAIKEAAQPKNDGTSGSGETTESSFSPEENEEPLTPPGG